MEYAFNVDIVNVIKKGFLIYICRTNKNVLGVHIYEENSLFFNLFYERSNDRIYKIVLDIYIIKKA